MKKLPPPVAACNGDTFLLCSDGLWEYVLESEMEAALAAAKTPRTWAAALLKIRKDRTEAKPDCDNYSLICAFIK